MADTISLLGAGASRDAGLPLMPDLAMGFKPWLAEKHTGDALLVELYDAAIRIVSTDGPKQS